MCPTKTPERLICREVQVSLAYRWFYRLGIEDAIPDHSAFSRARNERFREGEVFRRVFERVVEASIAAGLVGGEGFAVDASLIQADANKQRSIAGQDWRRDRDPARSSRAVKEYLATLDDSAWGAASDVIPKFVSPSELGEKKTCLLIELVSVDKAAIVERCQEHQWPTPAWRRQTKPCCKHRSTRFELAGAGFEQC